MHGEVDAVERDGAVGITVAEIANCQQGSHDGI
jgi:hypothetical protein